MRTPRTTTLGAALLIGLVCTSVQAREAFPKDSPIRTVCVACHVPDPQGNIPVLQSLRATPSAFRLIVRRMERNYKVKLTDEQRERAIRDLSRAQALSPAEYDELQNYLAAHPYEPLPPVPQGITLPKVIGGEAFPVGPGMVATSFKLYSLGRHRATPDPGQGRVR